MFSFNIINKPETTIQKKIIDNIIQSISNKIKSPQNWIINIVFVNNQYIKNLNNKYRKINKSTDVLSFWYFDLFEKNKSNEVVADLIFSNEKIKSQALEYKLWEEKEFYKLLIHAILHILWYDHIDDNDYIIMNDLEKQIWQEIFEK
jgi:probable rRNA maturation factor